MNKGCKILNKIVEYARRRYMIMRGERVNVNASHKKACSDEGCTTKGGKDVQPTTEEDEARKLKTMVSDAICVHFFS